MNDMEFDNWYDMLLGNLKKRGYSKSPDRDDAKELWDSGATPENAGDQYAEDWGDPGEETID